MPTNLTITACSGCSQINLLTIGFEENAPGQFVLGKLNGFKAGEDLSQLIFTPVVGGGSPADDSGRFSIVQASADGDGYALGDWVVVVADPSKMDYETADAFFGAIKFASSAQSGYTPKDTYNVTFGLNMQDVNEAPKNVALSVDTINEEVLGATIGALSAFDEDDDYWANSPGPITYAVGTGLDSDLFMLDVDGVTLKLKSTAKLDYETAKVDGNGKHYYDVVITATDAGAYDVDGNQTTGVGNASADRTVRVYVNDVVEAPTDNAPTVTGVATPVNAVDNGAAVQPFGGVTLTNDDATTVTITFNDADGVLSGAGLGAKTVTNGIASYTISGASASAVQTILAGLSFDPTDRAPNTPAVDTVFTLKATDQTHPTADAAATGTVTVHTTAHGDNAPTVTGVATPVNAVDNGAAVQPFTGVTLTNDDATTVTITFNDADGVLSGSGLGAKTVTNGIASYTISGASASAVQTILAGLSFDPTDRAPNTPAVDTVFTLKTTDQTHPTADAAATGTVTVHTTAHGDNAPTVTGVATPVNAVDNGAAVQPFGGVTLTNDDATTVTITFNDADGVLSGSGLGAKTVTNGIASYTISGASASAVQTILAGLSFNPTDRAPNTPAVDTVFTLKATDQTHPTADAAATGTVTVHTTAHGDNAPTVTGVATPVNAVDNGAAVQPFTGVTLTNDDATTVTITFNDADGVLSGSGLGAKTVTNGIASYTISGASASAVQTILAGLSFDPTDRAANSPAVDTVFTLKATDQTHPTADAAATGTVTVHTTAHGDNAPTVTGVATPVNAVDNGAAVQPFGGVTLTNDDATTVTITFNDADGVLSGAGLGAKTVTNGIASYTISGASASAVQTILAGLSFDPTDRAANSPAVDTVFTLKATDQTHPTADAAATGTVTVHAAAHTSGPSVFSIAATDAVKAEGDSGYTEFTFTITRSGDTTGESSVTWQVQGTGANPTSGGDFIAGWTGATETFAAGEVSKVITVRVAGDTAIEPDETFSVVLSAPTNGATISTTAGSADGTILDDDEHAPTFVVDPSQNYFSGSTGAAIAGVLAGVDLNDLDGDQLTLTVSFLDANGALSGMASGGNVTVTDDGTNPQNGIHQYTLVGSAADLETFLAQRSFTPAIAGQNTKFSFTLTDGHHAPAAYGDQITVLGEFPGNHAPVPPSASVVIHEGKPANSEVATFAAVDFEGTTIDYQFFGAQANSGGKISGDGRFQIVGNKVVALDLSVGSDTQATYVVKASDGTYTVEGNVTITIKNNQAPTIGSVAAAGGGRAGNAGTILVDDTAGAVQIAAVTASDPDAAQDGRTLTYALADTYNGLFAIDPDGKVRIADASKLPVNADTPYQLTIQVSDGSDTTTQAVTVTVVNVPDQNHAPGGLTLTVTHAPNEYEASGTVVGALSASDGDGDALSYALLDNAGGRFKLVGNQLVVDNGFLFDYEQAASHKVTVQVSDGHGGVATEVFTIGVTDVNPEVTGGTPGNDVFYGGGANDRLYGGGGNDRLFGGGGRDIVKGYAGNDTIGGGAGKDKLYGGKGRSSKDMFVFDTKLTSAKVAKANVDKIYDFGPKYDSIGFDDLAFTNRTIAKYVKKKGGATLDHALKIDKHWFRVGDKALDRNDFFIYNDKTHKLYFDVDGSGHKAMVEVASFGHFEKKTGLTLTFKDFFLI